MVSLLRKGPSLLLSDGDQASPSDEDHGFSSWRPRVTCLKKKTIVSPLRQRPGCYYHIRTKGFPSDRVQEPPIRLRGHGISLQKVTKVFCPQDESESSPFRWRPEPLSPQMRTMDSISSQIKTRAVSLRKRQGVSPLTRSPRASWT